VIRLNSLTVAGAAPALRADCKSRKRTGFPFNPQGENPGDT